MNEPEIVQLGKRIMRKSFQLDMLLLKNPYLPVPEPVHIRYDGEDISIRFPVYLPGDEKKRRPYLYVGTYRMGDFQVAGTYILNMGISDTDMEAVVERFKRIDAWFDRASNALERRLRMQRTLWRDKFKAVRYYAAMVGMRYGLDLSALNPTNPERLIGELTNHLITECERVGAERISKELARRNFHIVGMYWAHVRVLRRGRVVDVWCVNFSDAMADVMARVRDPNVALRAIRDLDNAIRFVRWLERKWNRA